MKSVDHKSLDSVNSLVLQILKQLQKEAIRQRNSPLVKKMMEIALAFLNGSLAEFARKEIAEALTLVLKMMTRKAAASTVRSTMQQATKEGTEEAVQKVVEKAVEVGVKEVTEEVGKRVSIKTAAKLARESTRGVFKRALIIGFIVDGVVCTYEVYDSHRMYEDGEISRREFHCRTVRSVSSAAGSTVGGAGGAVAGTFLGGLIGSIVPGIGTAIGASVGGFIGSVVAGTAGSIGGAQAGEYVNQAMSDKK